MVDWNLVAKIAGGGYGITFLVLIVISLLTWGMSLIVLRLKNEGKITFVWAL